jgi:hypothetical protein
MDLKQRIKYDNYVMVILMLLSIITAVLMYI